MKKSSEDFYKDLDLYKRKPGRCSCLSLAVFFVVLVAIFEFGLFSFFKNIKFSQSSDKINTPSLEVAELQGQQIAEGISKIYLSQGTLCSQLIKSRSGLQTCQITDEGIEIGGKISYLLPSNSTVLLLPTVEGGDLHFVVVKAQIGKVSMPKVLATGLGNIVEKSVKTSLSISQNVEFTSAISSQGLLTIVYKLSE